MSGHLVKRARLRTMSSCRAEASESFKPDRAARNIGVGTETVLEVDGLESLHPKSTEDDKTVSEKTL